MSTGYLDLKKRFGSTVKKKKLKQKINPNYKTSFYATINPHVMKFGSSVITSGTVVSTLTLNGNTANHFQTPALHLALE